jgi:Haem-NO-binding
MKELLGGMLNGIKDVLAAKAGEDSLKKILMHSGITDFSVFDSPEIPPKTLLEVLENLCRTLNIPLGETAEVYGEHWFRHYIPKITPYLGTDINNSRSFILKLNDIHSLSPTDNNSLPFFQYNWMDLNMLMLSCVGFDEWDNLPYYLFKGMVSGVAKFYNEDLRIFTGPSNDFIIIFPDCEIKRKKARQEGSSN